MSNVRRLVAIASDDGETVKVGHFGDANYYLIFEVSREGFKMVRRVDNPFRGSSEEHQHGVLAKRLKLLNILGKVDVIVSTFFGPGGEDFFRRRGIRPLKVRPKTKLNDVLKELMNELRQ